MSVFSVLMKILTFHQVECFLTILSVVYVVSICVTELFKNLACRASLFCGKSLFIKKKKNNHGRFSAKKKKQKHLQFRILIFFFLILQRVFCLQEQYYRFILMRIFEVYLSLGHLGIFMLFVLCLS